MLNHSQSKLRLALLINNNQAFSVVFLKLGSWCGETFLQQNPIRACQNATRVF